MVSKLFFSLALATALAVRGEPEQKPCPNGQVRFEGRATFEDERPKQLSKEAVLTIEVSEEVRSGEKPKAPLYTHNVPLDNYSSEKDITYNFCVNLKGMEAKKISLKAHILDQAENDKVEYIGETVVSAGSDSYEADLTLAKVEQGGTRGDPSVNDCQFGEMGADVRGIAVKASVKIGTRSSLPKPTVLAVSLREINPDNGEADVISLFAGDISGLYEPGKPVPAFLCAKVPVADESLRYTLDASAHMGWDGFANRDDDERTPRKGDLVSKREIDILVTPDQHDYSVEVEMKPFEPRQ